MKIQRFFNLNKALEISQIMNERPLCQEELDQYNKAMGYITINNKYQSKSI